MFNTMEVRRMEMNNELVTQAQNIGMDIVDVPMTQADVLPINLEKALASYTEVERQEILALADSIDVSKEEYGTDSIYCNSEKLCEIASDFENSKYHILYDEATKLWLVISNKGNIVTIHSSNGNWRELNISNVSDDIKVENTAFDKGVLYIPMQGSLYIINVKKQPITIKRMECDKLITPNSRLCNFNSNGFGIISNDILYDIYKG